MSALFHALVGGKPRGFGAALARIGLSAVSRPYEWAVRLRNRSYDAGWTAIRRVGVPVVSVGNLTVGGSGKTPCVEFLARRFLQMGVRVAILSRGYGSTSGPNDEALVLASNLPDVPHLQGVDRVVLAQQAIEKWKARVLILDDGFQHRRLARDVDLVLIDATNPWGYGRMFPRGLLREPLSALRRADAVIITRCDQVSSAEVSAITARIRRARPGAPVATAAHRPVGWMRWGGAGRPPESMCGQVVAGFCGVANPDAFRRTLESLDCQVADFRIYPDHHRYTRGDLSELHAWAASQPCGAMIVTTQKDMVKLACDTLGNRELLALRIEFSIRPGCDAEQIDEQLRKLVPLE
jgi:tetraacyldisaccharide 4'-kinase